MNQAIAGRRRKITRRISDIIEIILAVSVVSIFLLFVFTLRDMPMNVLEFVTSMMAAAIWLTALLSLKSLSQNRSMLRINRQMVEEMRKSRPQPSITTYIEKSTRPAASIPFSKGNRSISHSGETYDLVIKNVGREFARDIKVDYCTREIPESKPGEKPIAYDESQLVDSLPEGIDYIRPLGPGDDYRVDFDFITDPKIRYIKIIKITYSDGVESYQTGPYMLDTWGQRIG